MAGGEHAVDPRALREFANYVLTLKDYARSIGYDAADQGLSPAGFTGLLEPIGKACEEVNENVVSPTFDTLMERLIGMSGGVMDAAKQYGLDEIEAKEDMYRNMGIR